MSFKPFKPFDKMLCRDSKSNPWTIDIFTRYVEDSNFPYHGFTANWKECIHYEGNEHLYNTTNDYFKPEFGDLVEVNLSTGTFLAVFIQKTNDVATVVPYSDVAELVKVSINDIKPYKE